MKLISNETLIDSYFKALALQLDEDFVNLLFAEIKRRRLHLDTKYELVRQASGN